MVGCVRRGESVPTRTGRAPVPRCFGASMLKLIGSSRHHDVTMELARHLRRSSEVALPPECEAKFPASDDLPADLARRLAPIGIVVLVDSPEAEASEHVRAELAFARQAGQPVVQICASQWRTLSERERAALCDRIADDDRGWMTGPSTKALAADVPDHVRDSVSSVVRRLGPGDPRSGRLLESLRSQSDTNQRAAIDKILADRANYWREQEELATLCGLASPYGMGDPALETLQRIAGTLEGAPPTQLVYDIACNCGCCVPEE